MKYWELARLAGVSVSTVSKVMSGSREISRETAERVLRVAAEQGMTVVKGRCVKIDPDEQRVAVLVPELISLFYTSLANEVCTALENRGITPLLQRCGFESDRVYRAVDNLCRERIVSGIISLCSLGDGPAPALPTVVLETSAGDRVDCVRGDLRGGMREAIAHLKALGHTDIAFVGEPLTSQKQADFVDAMEAAGLRVNPARLLNIDRRFEEIGYLAVEQLAAAPPWPTALVAAYDEVALGAIHALRLRGVSVPDTVSVVGINDVSFARYSSVPLTTVQTYTAESVSTAVKLLIARINGSPDAPARHIVLKDRLVVRATTAAARKD